jgi:hypothetical protein
MRAGGGGENDGCFGSAALFDGYLFAINAVANGHRVAGGGFGGRLRDGGERMLYCAISAFAAQRLMLGYLPVCRLRQKYRGKREPKKNRYPFRVHAELNHKAIPRTRNLPNRNLPKGLAVDNRPRTTKTGFKSRRWYWVRLMKNCVNCGFECADDAVTCPSCSADTFVSSSPAAIGGHIISPQEHRFWEKMNFRQFAILFISHGYTHSRN